MCSSPSPPHARASGHVWFLLTVVWLRRLVARDGLLVLLQSRSFPLPGSSPIAAYQVRPCPSYSTLKKPVRGAIVR